jgi:hypothetical protein
MLLDLRHSPAHLLMSASVALAINGIGTIAAHAACIDVQTLTTSHHTVIYVWSPRMVGAVQEAQHAQEAAQDSGAVFVPVLDPRVSPEQAQAALERHPAAQRLLQATPMLCTADLPAQAFDHAPTLYVAAHGKLHPHRIIGIMPREAWREAITLRLAALVHDDVQ